MNTGGKTRKFLIATHGRLASGFKSALELIAGQNEHLFIVEAYVDENANLEAEIQKVLDSLGENDELLVFTDLLGGSVTNHVLQLSAGRSGVYIVAGINLPVVIEIVLGDEDEPAETIIDQAIENARNQLVFVNRLMAAASEGQSDD
jgi:fructoselysine and glucoselysine-specific PTS system IIA component